MEGFDAWFAASRSTWLAPVLFSPYVGEQEPWLPPGVRCADTHLPALRTLATSPTTPEISTWLYHFKYIGSGKAGMGGEGPSGEGLEGVLHRLAYCRSLSLRRRATKAHLAQTEKQLATLLAIRKQIVREDKVAKAWLRFDIELNWFYTKPHMSGANELHHHLDAAIHLLQDRKEMHALRIQSVTDEHDLVKDELRPWWGDGGGEGED